MNTLILQGLTCVNCQAKLPHIDPNDLRLNGYTCRRRPPQLVAVPTQHGFQVTGMYPVVKADSPACYEIVLDEESE